MRKCYFTIADANSPLSFAFLSFYGAAIVALFHINRDRVPCRWHGFILTITGRC
jgi:hypothetical protein